ncbi:MAG: 16S rRNA (guanine(527)-N(7))-methyltransferase RsmG [Burkholderiales bacterium]|nr:16S rRNA (guanine(527)-N(7))-methyltransferase RsmG [Burkholderiales bacterium]MBK8667493.1 16S rRNA (guanine(527)-N(7))-methyltransferase RsmG [Burkholderiales bacterium]
MTPRHPLRPRLDEGVAALGLVLSEGQMRQLLAYLDLLGKWNKVYNLTAVRDPAEMLTHHVLDSLAVVAPLCRYTQGTAVKLLDVGAGGGLPGVVIAICCPEIAVTCVDAVAKKVAFIQQIAASLGLPNLRGLHARVESVADRFDVVTSRAFASLGDFTAWSAQALAADGVWLAMKGRHPQEEIAALPPSIEMFHVEHLDVPGLDAERCLIWMRPRLANSVAPN